MLQNLKKSLAKTTRALVASPRARSRPHRAKHGRLLFEPLESRQMLNAGPLQISEFMAVNDTVWRDGTEVPGPQYEDWIEIHNPTAEAVDLTGWYLTDDLDKPLQQWWEFPVETINAAEYLVVFASGNGQPDAAGNWHTNFKLDGDGEYLALVQSDGETNSYAYSQEYPYEFPAQGVDVAYGLLDGQERFLPGWRERAGSRIATPLSGA